MKRESLFHYLIACAVLVVTGILIFHQVTVVEWEPVPPAPPQSPWPATVTDSRGEAVPSQPYQRIVLCAGATLVQQMTSVERIAAVVDQATSEDRATAWSFTDTPRIKAVADTEAILALHPDLVFAHASDDASSLAMARLKAAGCQVFDPGEVTTLAGLEKCCLDLGELLQARPQAKLMVESIQRRTRILALHTMPRAMPVQFTALPLGAAGKARLTTVLETAGLTLADAGVPPVRTLSLPKGALQDPVGSDILDIATALRMEFAPPEGGP